jgi:hypothetical protein
MTPRNSPLFVSSRRAQRDIEPGEIVVFARGDETQPLARYNGDDILETKKPATP